MSRTGAAVAGMRCILYVSVALCGLASSHAFSPAMPVGARMAPASTSKTTGRSGLRLGARGLRLDASNEAHAPTAMDWKTLTDYPWGSVETDFMAIATCGPESDMKWTAGKTVPYGDLSIPPRASILNYGQGLFEGMKAQRTEDGRIVIFRPNKNAKRAQYGCERLCMPPCPEDVFVQAVKDCILANAKWVPPKGEGTLYVRPIIFGSGPILGLAPAPSFTLCVYVSPVGSYFKGNQLTPIKLKLETAYTRAVPGGVGGVKAVGNYVPSMKPQIQAKKEGFDNVIFLDAEEGKYIEEVSTSNVFVCKDDVVYTPAVRGGGNPEDTILEGVTRDCLITLCKDKGYKVVEDKVPVELAMSADEAFTVGTAVVISPCGELVHEGKSHKLKGDQGPICKYLYETLVGIQTGAIEDPYDWTVYLD